MKPAHERPEWARTAIFSLTLAAPNDRNGNPRRCEVFFSLDGHLGTIDHGHVGRPGWASSVPHGGHVAVSATEYRDWIRCGETS